MVISGQDAHCPLPGVLLCFLPAVSHVALTGVQAQTIAYPCSGIKPNQLRSKPNNSKTGSDTGVPEPFLMLPDGRPGGRPSSYFLRCPPWPPGPGGPDRSDGGSNRRCVAGCHPDRPPAPAWRPRRSHSRRGRKDAAPRR